MDNIFSRTIPIFGKKGLEKLSYSVVAVFGLGGVGGYAAEALARCGVGRLIIVDGDSFDYSNLNRQIFALHSTIGRRKTQVANERLTDINPNIDITEVDKFITADNFDELDFSEVDYVIDAIDTLSTKLLIIERCINDNIGIISSMGTGGKVDITALKVDKIERTSVCPLARVMRRELKKRGISGVECVYSTEQSGACTDQSHKDGTRPAPSSAIFVPAAAGLMLAQHVVTNIVDKEII